MKKILLIIGVLSASLWSCKDGDGGSDSPKAKSLCDSVTYETMVKPILTNSCNTTGCHSAGAGGVDLRTYSKAKDASINGKLYQSINHEAGAKPMPNALPKLSDRELEIFNCWRSKGYPN